MFISRAELEQRTKSEHNLVQRIHKTPSGESLAVHDDNKFKLTGESREHVTIPDEIKPALIAAAIATTQKEVGAAIGVGQATIHRLEVQALEGTDEASENMRIEVFRQLADIREKAKQKLELCLNLVTEDTLEKINDKDKARVGSEIAARMSGIIDRTIPKDNKFGDNKSTHLHLYTPEQRKLSTLNVVTVNENEQTGS